jgi:hypothetical protein
MAILPRTRHAINSIPAMSRRTATGKRQGIPCSLHTRLAAAEQSMRPLPALASRRSPARQQQCWREKPGLRRAGRAAMSVAPGSAVSAAPSCFAMAVQPWRRYAFGRRCLVLHESAAQPADRADAAGWVLAWRVCLRASSRHAAALQLTRRAPHPQRWAALGLWLALPPLHTQGSQRAVSRRGEPESGGRGGDPSANKTREELDTSDVS